MPQAQNWNDGKPTDSVYQQNTRNTPSGGADTVTSGTGTMVDLTPSKPAQPAQPTESLAETAARLKKQKASQPTKKSKVIESIPSYKHGTDYVPKTGLAVLHQGEKVVNKKNADKERAASAALSALGGGEDEKPPKELDHIRTRKVKNSKGGRSYIHEHHYTHPEHYPKEEHASNDQDAMVDHMMTHMGEPNPGEAEADAGQSSIPGEQAAPAAA